MCASPLPLLHGVWCMCGRVVHALSSFNLYEDAIETPRPHHDDLLAAITEDTTQ